MHLPFRHVPRPSITYPSEPETQKVHHSVVEHGHQLSVVDTDKSLAVTTQIGDVLLDSREITVQYTLLSPIHDIPQEVLQYIFGYCMPLKVVDSASSKTYYPAGSTKSPILPYEPVLFSQVCTRWRNAIIAASELWCDFHIDARTKSLLPIDLYENVTTRLIRSGGRPLAISTTAGADETLMIGLYKALIPYSSSWKHLVLTGPFQPLEILGSLTSRDVPLLETIKFHRSHSRNRQGAIEPNLVMALAWMKGAPRLRDVMITGLRANLPVPWAQLDALALSTTPYTATLEILQHCTRLQDLFIIDTASTYTPFTSNDTEPLVMPQVKSLKILGRVPLVLEELHLPNLLKMDVNVVRFSGEPVGNIGLTQVLSRGTSLTSLTLQNMGTTAMWANELSRYLRHAPALLSLSIIDSPGLLHNRALQALTPRVEVPSSQWLCPQLEEINFTRCRYFTDMELIKFIRSRTSSRLSGIQCLRNIYVSLDRPSNMSPLHEFVRTLNIEALEITVRYISSDVEEPLVLGVSQLSVQ